MATTIFPTQNDVGTNPGDGRIATEENFAGLLKYFAGPGIVISGLAPSEGGGLNVDVAAGEAFLAGYHVTTDATLQIAITDSAVRGLHLQLTRDGFGRVTGVQLVDSAQTTPGLTDAILIAVVETAGGAVLRLHDERSRSAPGYAVGRYVGDGSSSRLISLPETPSLVMVFGTGTNNRLVTISGMRPPGFRDFDSGSAPALPGFRIVDSVNAGTHVSISTPAYLTASTTWDPPTVSGTNSTSVDVSVPGAKIGDLVSVSHTAIPAITPHSNRYESLTAQVTEPGVVTVTYTVQSPGVGNRGSGTLSTTVIQGVAASVNVKQDAEFSQDTTGQVIPFIEQRAIRIGGAATGQLNRNATAYSWIAFY